MGPEKDGWANSGEVELTASSKAAVRSKGRKSGRVMAGETADAKRLSGRLERSGAG